MPTIMATNTPHDAATIMSRRCAFRWFAVSLMSQRPVQHRRSLDQRHQIEQHDDHTERNRDRDRARAAAALLLLGQHDPVVAVAHGASPNPNPSRASRLSASSAANSTNT